VKIIAAVFLTLAAVPTMAASDGLLGQSRWISEPILGIRVCEKMPGDFDRFQCPHVKKGKLTADERIPHGNGDYYHVVFENGQTGFINAVDVQFNTTARDPAIAVADCKRTGSPQIGMTKEQVRATCWGKPQHVNRTETASSIDDQYVYSGGRYVYLRNGVVESIQRSGRLR
jgi:hypothetical protein